MAAYAALVSLMNNIEQIKNHTRLPIHFDQKQSETLLEKVIFLIDFLENYNYSSRVCKEMEELESRITDAAYAAEDIIETHVVDTIHAHPTSRKGMDKVMAHLRWIFNQKKNPYLPGIEKVMDGMDFIQEEAMKIKDTSGFDSFLTISSINAPSSSSTLVGKNVMVGFDNELNELQERLTGRHSSRQVISIVGMGGKGKTTLARTAYEKHFVGKHFDFRAWVSISQEYSFRQILIGLLGKEYESSEMEEEQLGESLYKKLFGRRYLIVLDDIWSAEAWNRLQRFLPDDNNGSRIIVTTRISSLATDFGWCNLKVNFLDEEKGWNLFCDKVFGQECCPHELEEVGREIVKNCRGLPLSIVVIGGLLANSERTKKYWEYIAHDTSAIISSEGDELCMKILYLSYHNLPVHLKPCFLYMGVFPEDKIINVSMLIKQWVAEGFMKPNSSKDLEVVAEEYLNDLISRNLVIVRGHGHRGRINRCMIHDLLRNLCLKEAQKGKFLYVPTMHVQDDLRSIDSQRRISIPTRSNFPIHLGTSKPGFLGRSLICLEALPLKNFGLLRVLQGSDRYGDNATKYSLGDTFKQVNLRFIVIKASMCKEIPLSLCLLWNLQILIVQVIDSVPTARLDIWEMTALRHLEFYRRGFYILDPPHCQQMNTREGDAIMKNLQKLKGIINFRLSDEVVRRIPNIKTLKIYYSLTGKEWENMCLKSFVLLENLESLKLSFNQRIGSDLLSNLTFPNSLKKLTLLGYGFHWEDMSTIASLLHLQVLELFSDAFIGQKWVLDEEDVFRCLKFLLISNCKDLKQWVAEDTHFPCLEYLGLFKLDKLVEIPSGIGDIPTLQEIHLVECSKSAVISAKEILEEQEKFDNVGIRVIVTYCAELESLASDNFLFHKRKE